MTMFNYGPINDWANNVTSLWGDLPAVNEAGHNGIDFRGVEGETEIIACHSGTVRLCEYQSTGFGNVVVIENEEIETTYAHMFELPDLALGEKIVAGQVIGRMGNTGASTGAHLHFGLRIKPWSFGGTWNGYSDPTYALRSVEKREEAQIAWAQEHIVEGDTIMQQVKNGIIPIVTLVIGAIEALIAVLLGFDVINWTGEQASLVMVLVVAIGAIVSWLILRKNATPLSRPVTNDGEQLLTVNEAVRNIEAGAMHDEQ